MPYELGGRADKRGNRFEFRWVIYQILQVIEERLDHVVLESIGDDEKGVDIWIGERNDIREGQQCKGRNGSLEYWSFGTANNKQIFTTWKNQLDRNDSNTVALVSPLAFTFLEDLIDRAKNTSQNPKDFYTNQILNASQEFKKFFENFCKVMMINIEEDLDLVKCISYLNRISYRQIPNEELKNLIISKISYLLVGDEGKIYDTFVAWIVDGNILGTRIDLSVLYTFLRENNIQFKNLAFDNRIVPRIIELNQEYMKMFVPLNDELIQRSEFSICKDSINMGSSLIIHGKAGRGKSGCTEDIIEFCQKEDIPYLAIKLDKRVPNGTADNWGKYLGLPASVAHCIHSVSKDKRAVLILDQLDALRWTQAHSRDALLVCAQIIKQVEELNAERTIKISIVFVCRTYDLDNDNTINSLFNNKREDVSIQWVKIQVKELDEKIVENIIGKNYEQLSRKLKELLRIPSNLYIWQRLDKDKEYNECLTTSHLVSKWWEQLLVKCFEFGLSEEDLNKAKNKVIEFMENNGRIYAPLQILDSNKSSLDFLSSNAFLAIQDKKVSFIHQSVLDYFLSETMLRRYYAREDIVAIIGTKEKQTPGKRYQVQMFMQNLSEVDCRDLIDIGMRIFEAEQVRYYVKFIFFEILNQIEIIDENVENFIIRHCEDNIYGEFIINHVMFSRPQYIRLLRKNGFFDKWVLDSAKKQIVFNLLVSMSPNYVSEDVLFIEKCAVYSEDNCSNLVRCFSYNIGQDTDEMFNLRMKLYEMYPQIINEYFNFKSMFKNCEIRTTLLLVVLLKNTRSSKMELIYQYEVPDNSEIFIKNGSKVVDLLLPHIFIEKEKIVFQGYSHNLERICVEIIKKANAAIILANPKQFFEIYKDFMGKGIDIPNEIILSGLSLLPESYSNRVINCICRDFDKNIFDKTSSNGDELYLAKSILKKHSQYCSKKNFSLLEEKILSYQSPKATKIYKSRIEYNSKHKDNKVYLSFWGDLQIELLSVLPNDRLSSYAKDLKCVLERKFPNGTDLYRYSAGHGGFVKSPLLGKKLNNKSWLQVLTNDKLKLKKHNDWKKVPGGFIENSIEQFANSFENAVSEDPIRMIKLILMHKDIILDKYIDSLFRGVANSKNLEYISIELLERMILCCSYDSLYRATSICSLIEKKKGEKWSQEILDILKDIARFHKEANFNAPNVTNKEDKEMNSFELLTNAINCVRGQAAHTIGKILRDNSDVFPQFKDTIEHLASDENPAVKMASMFALCPSYKIEKEWASNVILKLCEQDFRLAGHLETKQIFFLLYPKYRERVLSIIKKCYESEDNYLIEMGASHITEMFILKEEFSDIMSNVNVMNETQAKAVISMSIIYFNEEAFNIIAKDIIRRFLRNIIDFEAQFSRLFYDDRIDLKRDKDFLIEIVESNLSHKILHSFLHYLEKESKSVIDYKDIILKMSYHLIENECVNKVAGSWGVEDKISKLVIGLYDEASSSPLPEMKNIAQECLEVWDLMFEKQIGAIRSLSKKLMDR